MYLNWCCSVAAKLFFISCGIAQYFNFRWEFLLDHTVCLDCRKPTWCVLVISPFSLSLPLHAQTKESKKERQWRKAREKVIRRKAVLLPSLVRRPPTVISDKDYVDRSLSIRIHLLDKTMGKMEIIACSKLVPLLWSSKTCPFRHQPTYPELKDAVLLLRWEWHLSLVRRKKVFN